MSLLNWLSYHCTGMGPDWKIVDSYDIEYNLYSESGTALAYMKTDKNIKLEKPLIYTWGFIVDSAILLQVDREKAKRACLRLLKSVKGKDYFVNGKAVCTDKIAYCDYEVKPKKRRATYEEFLKYVDTEWNLDKRKE